MTEFSQSAARMIAGTTPIPGGWMERTYPIGGHEYRIAQPADPDAFLDDPQVQAFSRAHDYMPYWPFLWPAAIAMGERVAAHRWPAPAAALELGCGVGLLGIVALRQGLDVTFTDYDRDAVDVALSNAAANGFPNARGVALDWRDPPAMQFPIVLGCEVIYEAGNHEPILALLARELSPGGTAWFGDAGRQHAPAFIEHARRLGYRVRVEDDEGNELAEPRAGRFQLIILDTSAEGG